MKNVFQKVLIASMLTVLVACPTEVKPPDVEPPVDETPIKSAFGTPVGTAVTQTFDATGGTFSELTTGVTVKAFAGGFDSSAQVSVQPITNTLPDGIGMGVEISSSQPLKKPLIVRFNYAAAEPDPNSLRLAAQTDDGSWLSLAPVKIDTVNRTVSAALPDSFPPTKASSRIKPKAALNLKRVVKYLGFYMKPENATVKVGKSVEFVPYARVLERINDCVPTASSDGELTTLCPNPVVKAYPFTNNKAGFGRTWWVNGTEGGDSTNGTIQPKPTIGATYTAPTIVPIPNTVEVRFLSTKIGENPYAYTSAKVTIVGNNYKVVGDFTSVGYPACAGFVGIADLTDHVEFTLVDTGNFKSPYSIEIGQNPSSENKNFRASQYTAGAKVTQNSLSEVLNATKGRSEFKRTLETLSLTLEGGSWTGGCTVKYPEITFNYPAGDTVPSSASFEFNVNDFVNNTKKVKGEDQSGFGSWEFTITKQ
jgi:hypothetical protein